MASKRRFEGQSIEEAVRAASQSLGIPVSDLDYVLLDEGRRGVLGMGARACRIEVVVPPQLARLDHDEEEYDDDTVEERDDSPGDVDAEDEQEAVEHEEEDDDEDEPEDEPEVAEDAPEELVAARRSVEETLGRMFELMKLKIRIRSRLSGNTLRVQLGGADRKLLSQKDGQLLSSIQFLLNRMARRAWPDLGRLQLQCDGYRNRRDDEVIELVKEVASQVKRTGQAKRLHPMNPYERRLAHLTVREYSGLSSRSEGDGFLKKITISPGKQRDRRNTR
jgi:spoIIIJ-associated protein